VLTKAQNVSDKGHCCGFNLGKGLLATLESRFRHPIVIVRDRALELRVNQPW